MEFWRSAAGKQTLARGSRIVENETLVVNDGLEMPRNSGGSPFVPLKMPSYVDPEPLGFSYFRSGLENADLSNLSLPRAFLGRSLFAGVSFHNSDLSESRMCWNDFVACDFSNADLAGCDLRASNYTDCDFTGANLTRADLRCSSYENCDFAGAVMTEAVSDRPSAEDYGLSECLLDEQQASKHWHAEPGEEPEGG